MQSSVIIHSFVYPTRAVILPGEKPLYVGNEDVIYMPPVAFFSSPERYHATLLHELVHWSGYYTRLDRTVMGKPKGTREAAIEELVAEMASKALCEHLGVVTDGFTENMHYWLQQVKGEEQVLMLAWQLAEEAVHYLSSFSR